METTLISESEREELRLEVVAICDENDRAMGLDSENYPTTPAQTNQAPLTFLTFLMGMSLGLSLGAGVVLVTGLIFLH